MLIPLGILSQGGVVPPGYFVVTGDANSQETGSSTVDADGNTYAVAGFNVSGGRTWLVKVDPAGVIVWVRQLQSESAREHRINERGNPIAVDSNGDIYYAATFSPGGGSWEWFIAKFNSAGVVQWTRRKTRDTGDSLQVSSVSIDSENNAIITGLARETDGNDYATVVKVNSSGTLQWQRRTNITGSKFTGSAIDSTDNTYVASLQSISGAGTFNHLYKIDSAGNLVWVRNSSYAASGQLPGGVAVDSNDDVYLAGFVIHNSVASAYILKASSAGARVWEQTIASAGVSQPPFNSIKARGKDIYAVESIIYKLNDSGAIQWQRQLFRNTSRLFFNTVTDSGPSLYNLATSVSGFGPGGQSYFLTSLPADGSKTDTYSFAGGDIVYSAGSATITAGTATLDTPSVTLLTPGNDFGVVANTAGTPTFTTTTLTI
jgi:hypothetical protein